MSKQTTRQRIAAVNGALTEGQSRGWGGAVDSWLQTLRDLRTEIVGIKQFRQGPSADALGQAWNGLSDAIVALEEYKSVAND